MIDKDGRHTEDFDGESARTMIRERSPGGNGWRTPGHHWPLLFALLLPLLLPIPGEGGESWKAGVAKINITPDEPLLLSGKRQRTQPATKTLPELWAKAVVLEDPAGNRALLVTLDLVGIGREVSDAVRDALMAQHGIQRRQVALCTSHTHNGPVVGGNLALMFALDETQQARIDQYATELQSKIVKLAGEAFGRLVHLQAALRCFF